MCKFVVRIIIALLMAVLKLCKKSMIRIECVNGFVSWFVNRLMRKTIFIAGSKTNS